MADGSWQGRNLTYYGLFNALALCAAVALVLILTGAAGVPVPVFAVITCTLLGICLPASSGIAGWVEKKPSTFSVGAASFLGIVLGPWVVMTLEAIARRFTGIGFDPMAVMSALMVAYALGEGIGRLACISFGCCYGKPVDRLPKTVRRYFSWAAFTYTGCTKKIAYAHHLDGQKIFAVPAVTAVLYSISALAGTLLHLSGRTAWAFFLCLFVTQIWRFFSEFLRADYRGDRKISVYQIMSLATVPYGLLLPFVFPAAGPAGDIMAGLRQLWNPTVILFLQAIGVIMFLRTGRSEVTGSGVSFYVNEDRI
jgi:prolipoprotein diacylglyceryltransferase